jgi:thiosulfate dehydrogenase [quinone] large subunit
MTTAEPDARATGAPMDRPALEGRASRAAIWLVRIVVALVWLQGAGWKRPPDFGESTASGLYRYTAYAVDYPVFGPWKWFVQDVVLPNFTAFGWLVLITEAALGAFLLIGLATRFWAIVGALQALAIGLSAANGPNEFGGTYWVLVVANLALFATAAGRVGGLDGVLRPAWRASRRRIARWMAACS